MENIRVIIPAAGKGTRLHAGDSDLPKVMFRCAGKPLLETVLSSVGFVEPKDIYIVVGYRKDVVISYFGDRYNYVEQKEQLGTGHAVMMCADSFADFDGTVLVTFGDMPLFRPEDLTKMCRLHVEQKASCTLMTAENTDLCLWARIKRRADGRFERIVEGKDCTPDEAKIKELFAGVIVFDSKALFATLPEVRTNNVQGEYYLTEVPELMAKKGMKVETYRIDNGDDLRGVNTPEDMVICERILLDRMRETTK